MEELDVAISGENPDLNIEGQKPDTGERDQQPSYEDKIKEIAAKAGWKDSGPMDAEEFLATMPDRFKDKGKELKDLKRSVDAIKNTFEKAQETAYQRGVEAAQERLKAAKAAFDPDGIEQATRELEAAKVNKPTIAKNLSDEAEAFVNNPLLDKNPDMFTDAMDYRNKYLRTHPDDIDGALLYAKRKIEKDYPEAFAPAKPKEDKRPPAGGVEGVRGATVPTEQWKKDEALMMPHEIELMKAFTNQMHNGKPLMTKEEYIKNLRAQGAFNGRSK